MEFGKQKLEKLIRIGMSRHVANIRHREIIIASIPWRLDGSEELSGQRCFDGLKEQGGQRCLNGLEELGSQRRLDGLEELGGRIQVGDWIGSPAPDTSNPLD